MKEFDFERYNKILEMKEEGYSDKEIGLEVGLSSGNVKHVIESGKRWEMLEPIDEGKNVPRLNQNSRRWCAKKLGIKWPETTYEEAKQILIDAIANKKVVKEKWEGMGIGIEDLSKYVGRELVFQKNDPWTRTIRFKDEYEEEKAATHEWRCSYKKYEIYKVYDDGRFKYCCECGPAGKMIIGDYLYEVRGRIDKQAQEVKQSNKAKKREGEGMKTWGEITTKIDELMDKAKGSPVNGDDALAREMIYNQIDALLWVIGDRSGKEI